MQTPMAMAARRAGRLGDAPGDEWTLVGMVATTPTATFIPARKRFRRWTPTVTVRKVKASPWFPGDGTETEDVTDGLRHLSSDRVRHAELCEGTFDTQFEFEVSGMSMTFSPKVVVEGIGTQIDGRGESRLFEVGTGVGTLELVNLRLMNGDAERGGAILADTLDLVLDEVSFTDNHADGAGGAVYIEDGSIELNGVDYLRNTSDGHGAHGGAIYLGTGEVSGVDVVMLGNEASGMASGGAIFLGEAASISRRRPSRATRPATRVAPS